jgi:predicted nucleotidyltransferase
LKKFGLSIRDIHTIENIFQKYPLVRQVRIFGSRSKATQNPGSDIDLAIMGNDLSFDDLLHLKSDFEESDLPYEVDLVYYPELKHEELREHIDRVGMILYRA